MEKIKLNLTKHCIETELKRQYNQSISMYFKSGGDKERLEKQIRAMQKMLANCDFGCLRSVYPELAGNVEIDIFLILEKKDRIIICCNGSKIDPFKF